MIDDSYVRTRSIVRRRCDSYAGRKSPRRRGVRSPHGSCAPRSIVRVTAAAKTATKQAAVEFVKPSDLIPHPRNPRKHDIPRIIRSIRGTGWHSVVTAQKSTKHILVGHGRTEAAQTIIAAIAAGDPDWTAPEVDGDGNEVRESWVARHPDDPLVHGVIPVEWKDLTDAEALSKVLADNKTSDEGGYDRDLMTQLLVEQWAENELEASAWTQDEIAKLQRNPADDLDTGPQLSEFEYRIIVRVANEEEQAEVLQRLTSEGLNVQALTS